MFVAIKPWKECQAEFLLLCRALAESAFRGYHQHPERFLYLVGTKQAGLDTLRPWAEIWASILVDSEGSMLELACGEYIPRDLTVDQLCDWIRVRLSKQPLWIFAD